MTDLSCGDISLHQILSGVDYIFNVDRFVCYLLRVKKNTPVILSLLLCCAVGGLAMGVPESVIGQEFTRMVKHNSRLLLVPWCTVLPE